MLRFGTWPTGICVSSLVRRQIDDRDGVRAGVRDVGALAVGRERHPVRMVADLRFAGHLQIRQ